MNRTHEIAKRVSLGLYNSRRNLISVVLSVFIALCIATFAPTPAYAVIDCTDGDGDGYGVGVDCLGPDCNDGDGSIHPGAAESCNGIDDDCDSAIDETFVLGRESTLSSVMDCADGIDNDGDGDTDDDDAECFAGYCFWDNPPSCSPDLTIPSLPPAGTSCCITREFLLCKGDGSGTECPPPLVLDTPVAEVPYTLTCHDGEDNDCDQQADGDDADCVDTEKCNGLDDDFDGDIDEDFQYSGIDIGDPCTVGIGECERTGNVICSGDSSADCSAVAAAPGNENTPGEGNCVDGLDNDCDGLIDLAQVDCQEAEKCDGLDNDGDVAVDEDFVDLGDACSAGEGACEQAGVMACNDAKDGTECDAVALLASAEGPTGETCTDGIDNDCDGLTDVEEDPSCGSANLEAWCTIPYTHGRPGVDCTGKHEIHFGAFNAGFGATISAELLALDVDGTQLAAIPVVDGDFAHLVSRLDPEDWRWDSKTNKKRTNHSVFAPVPILQVTVKDGSNEARAYCSNIPYLKVIEPDNQVVSESEGNVTQVLTAIPLVDASSLFIKVDGVDILTEMGISDPSTCTPGSPCQDTININSQSVTVSELVVTSSPVDSFQDSNTMSMKLSDLGCGGHIIVVEGVKMANSFPDIPDEECNEDDLSDKGTSSVFAIEIDSPTEGEIVAIAPVNVTGRVCHGREIASLLINGKDINVSPNDFTPGDGTDSGDLYEVQINEFMDETNLVQDFSTGDISLGTFDPGSNRIIADATDDQGNRTFKTQTFALGSVALPELTSLVESFKTELENELKEAAVNAYRESISTESASELDNAFAVGLKKEAIQKVFDERCQNAGVEFKQNLEANIINQIVDERTIEVSFCSCDPPTTTKITGFSIDETTISCDLVFVENEIQVTVNLPTIDVSLGVEGYCRYAPVADICVSKTIISGFTNANLVGAKLDFKITEAQLLGDEGPGVPVFTPPVASEPPTAGISVSIHCLGAVCDFFLTPIAVIVNAIADSRLIPVIGFGVSIDVVVEAEVGSSQPDPIELGNIKMDEEKIEEFKTKMQGILSAVEITPNGLVAGLIGKFETTSVDPEVEVHPAAVTPTPLPVLPVTSAEDAFVVISRSAFNQLFSSMTLSGELKTNCQDSGKTIGDLLPVDCEGLTAANNLATAAIQGICHGLREADCEGLTWDADAALTATKQGACHGVLGDNCTTIPAANPIIERAICNATPTLNIVASDPLLFCVRADIPPQLFIEDNNATDPVETALRLNDLGVALIVDRNSNGLDGELSAVPKCFATGSPTVGDCNMYAVCLDMNFKLQMSLAPTDGSVCETDEPGFQTVVDEIQILNRQEGVVCGGATAAVEDGDLASSSAGDTTIVDLTDRVDLFTPPLCAEGLTLGSFVGFDVTNAKLIAIESDGDSSFQEYLGITGAINSLGP